MPVTELAGKCCCGGSPLYEQKELATHSKYVVVALNRFLASNKKRTLNVQIADVLSVCGASYKLKANIVHVGGNSMASGRFVAYVWNCGTSWYVFSPCGLIFNFISVGSSTTLPTWRTCHFLRYCLLRRTSCSIVGLRYFF